MAISTKSTSVFGNILTIGVNKNSVASMPLAGRQNSIRPSEHADYSLAASYAASTFTLMTLEEGEHIVQIDSRTDASELDPLRLNGLEPQSSQDNWVTAAKQFDDAVLSSIMELAVNAADRRGRFPCIRSLAQVCRRFRDLILKNPKIWTSLDSSSIRNEPSMAAICAQRSLDEKLDVTLDTSDRLMACLAILSSAVTHSTRWKSFTVRSPYDADHWRQEETRVILDAIETSCRGAVLSSLEHLEFDFLSDVIHGIDCTSWTMPNLRRLSVYNFVPTGIFHSLKSFHIHLNALYQPHVLTSLLTHAPSLEALELELVKFHSLPHESFARVVHWGIKSLRLRVESTEWSAMKPFYETLRFPALRRMHISLLDFGMESLGATSFIENLVPDPQWSRINILELHVATKYSGQHYLELPFRKLAHLDVLSLQTDHHLWRSNLWPPLAALEVTNSGSVTQMWLEDSINDMRRRGVWARLRIVSISNCRQFTRAWLEGVVGSRLLFGQSLSVDDLIRHLQSARGVVPWAAEPLVRLPIEVLEVVLQSAVLSVVPSERYKCASRLAGVCSSFRKAMLSMPALWTDIHSRAAANNDLAVYTGIKRSLDHGLHITLEVEDGAQTCIDLLDIATPHAHRWHSFTLRDVSGASRINHIFSAMDDYVKNLDLPRLGNLNLNYDFPRGQTWAEMLAAGVNWKGHLYKLLNVPSLDSLSCSGVVPVPIISAKSLTKFDFLLARDLNFQKPRLLISFLANVPSLEELSLFFMCFNPPANLLDISATLPNLRKFSVRITDTNWEPIRPIYQALKTPKLRDLHVRLQFLSPFSCALDVTTYLRNLLPDVNMCRLIGLHLNVFVEEDPFRGYEEHITLPLSEDILPHLRQLSIETNMPLLPSPECPPPLTEIRILNSHLVDLDWLIALRTQMESMHTWNAVETVEINNCGTLLASKQELRLVVPEDKLLV